VFFADCIFLDSQLPMSTDFTGIYINIPVIIHGITAYLQYFCNVNTRCILYNSYGN
jgi:hypothetical protein